MVLSALQFPYHTINLVLLFLGKSGWRSGHQSCLPPLLQMLYVDWVSVDLNLTSRVFSWHSGFAPPQKSTPSLIHLAVVLCFEVIYGSCLGAERLAGCTASSVRPRWAAPFAIQSTDCEKGWLAAQTFYILLLLLVKVIGPEMPQKEEVQSSIHLQTRFGLLDLSKYQRLIWTKIFLQTFGT